MKVPFRFQASEYDCVPTTLLNALNYLCARGAIPPLAIQRIFMYCLDTVTSQQGLGHGTSEYAVQLFAHWLNEYQTKAKDFRIRARYISGKEVHLSQNNLIAQTLNDHGAVALRVKSTGRQWHYILCLRLDSELLYAFDPYPKQANKNKRNYRFEKWPGEQEYNLVIRREWLDTQSNNNPYQLGSYSEREALLLTKF